MTVTLTNVELAAVVAAAVGLAATDAAALSDLAVAAVARRLGLEPGEVSRWSDATE